MSYYALEQTAGFCRTESTTDENQSDTAKRNYQFSFSLHQRSCKCAGMKIISDSFSLFNH